MRPTFALIATLGIGTVAQAAPSGYFLEIEGVTRPAPAGPLYLKVSSTGDLDGDGLPDEAVLRITCASRKLAAAHYYVTGPRDAASGQASGKRMHKPLTIVKEWGAASPQLMKVRPTYDIKGMKGARIAADPEGWAPISLAQADELCPAAEQATGALRSRSNIQNN